MIAITHILCYLTDLDYTITPQNVYYKIFSKDKDSYVLEQIKVSDYAANLLGFFVKSLRLLFSYGFSIPLLTL